MATSLRKLRAKYARRAIVLEIGGFRPSTNPADSWFGRVNLALKGETWPQGDDGPMHALCQINLTKLPFRPPRLDDLDFLTVFIGPKQLPRDAPNGTHWCLRAYRDIGALVPLKPVKTGGSLKALPMRASVLEADYPCYDDMADDLSDDQLEEVDKLMENDEFEDLYPVTSGFKLGGWPALIQGEISWGGPANLKRALPEYVFQISTTQKGNWMWGDNGTGYFGRGTAAGRTNEWALAWQCY